ncbi:unnamed protein product [Adineta ricciae]|uniref:USP domain-containing protein n=1 Tax=Adineta ricciae TaxID=249248 RepID=A0A813XKI1_ADIRI|nr:unnamed protein product [Adineta ricciae]
MQPPCALCSTLVPILEKYSSLELIEAIDLQKEDICTFVLFVTNWPQNRCACLCRDAITIERFSSLVEWLLLYIINLLQTFITADNPSDDDFLNQSNESDSSTQICSILTTTDQEQQRQYRQWSLEEKERLLLCVARCFTLNLPIYTTAHRNPSLAHHVAYYQMQHASADFKTFLSSYCHLNLSSNNASGNNDSHHVSLYLYRHICSFCENRGLIVIRQVFESAKNTRMLPLSIAHTLFLILTNLRQHLNIDIIKNFLLPIRPHAIRYMCLLSDNELRLCGQKNTNDLLYASLKDLFLTTTFRQRSTSSNSVLSPYNTKHHHTVHFQRYHFDRLMLTLALKYLTCSTLTIRLTGLSHITNQIQQCLDYTQYRRHQSMAAAAAAAAAASCCSHNNTTTQEILTVSESDGEDEAAAAQKVTNDTSSSSSSASSADETDEYPTTNHHERKLCNWIIENKIIHYLFGPNLHTELLKQCLTILIFLASNNRLTVEHIDLIWSCVSLTHCSRHILDLLMNLGQKNLNINLLNHLLQLIGRSDRSQYTESTLTLISILTKSYWSQLIRSSNTMIQNKKQQELVLKQKFQRNSLNMQNILRQQKTLKRQPSSPLKRIDRNKNVAMIRQRGRLQHKNTPHLIRQTSPSSPLPMSRPISGKKPAAQQQPSGKIGAADEDSAEEVIIVESPQQPLTEQNVSKLMANKCKDLTSQNLLKSNPSSAYILCAEKKNDDSTNANVATDEWSDDDDDEDDDENNDESMRNASVVARGSAPFIRRAEPTSSNDDDDDDESENEARIIPREVLMQHRSRFQRAAPANQDESDEDETVTNVHSNMSQMYKPEDLSTPTKRPTTGSGFIINSSKNIVLPDDQMDIDDDDDDDDPNEISDEDLRGMVIPSVVQSSLKHQMNQKGKQQQQQQHIEKDVRQHHDDGGNRNDHEMDTSKKRYSEKVCSPESAEDASQAGSLPSEMETEIYDCREAMRPKKKRARHNTDDGDDDDDDDEEEEECDFGSSASDVLSETGSVKNMDDFDDMSESEQQQQQQQQQQQTTCARRMRINHPLSDMVSSTPSDQQTRKRLESEQNLGSQTSSSSSSSSSAESTNDSSTTGHVGAMDDDEINISNLSSPGQTLLWDLLQDQTTANTLHLPDTLLNETERLFSQVLSSIEDKRILLHFIRACLDNLKKSSSSLISLRLLPKLFLIFQQHQPRANTNIFLIFEEKYHVLSAFFNDLEQLTKRVQANPSFVSIHNEITVRFQFLSFIFSISASPKEFNLTQNQADKLWDCLTIMTGTTGTNREELYNWLLSQLKNRDGGHALSLETFKHLLTEKLLIQKPEHVCCQQLSLIQEILQQSRSNWVHVLQQQQTSPTTCLTQQCNDFQTFEFLILNYVSDVAMRALDQNVSTLAAQTLNSYQIQNEDGSLDREEPFIARCMNCLNECISTVHDLSSLRTINRISVLLRTHLELFTRRYSYVMRLYQYIAQTNNNSNSNQLFSPASLKSHIKQIALTDERDANLIKLICSAPMASGGTEKYILKMNPNDLIGDLRAELTRWYCTLKPPMTNVLAQTLLTIEKNDLPLSNPISSSTSPTTSSFDLLHMSTLPSIRVLANGQELDRDIDDKTLNECNIKENQTILVNASTRNRTKDLYTIDERLLKNYIPQKMPMMLLLKYIDQFFSILAQLQIFIETSAEHSEARLAVSRLWEILLLIPTHTGIFQNLSQLNEFNDNENNSEQWAACLQGSDPFRFTYSLQIIDMLIRRMPTYKDMFVRKGGLKYLYDLFILKSFFTGPVDRSWCAGLPEALLYTLKILCSCLLKIPTPSVQSSTPQQQQQQQVPPPPPASAPPVTFSTAIDEQHSPRTPINTRKKTRRETTTPALIAALSSSDLTTMDIPSSTPAIQQQSHFHICESHWENVALIDKDVLLDTLVDIQLSIVTKSTRLCCPVVLLQFANRTDLLHTSMVLFITLCHSYDDVRTKFIEHPKLSLWLKTLLLDAYDSLLKREALFNIYRLSMVASNNISNNSSGTSDELNLQPITDFPPPPPIPTQRSCPIDEEKAAQTLTISTLIEPSNDPPVERICLVPILTNLLELIPYALKFTSSSSQSNFESPNSSLSSISLQPLHIPPTLITKCDNHSLFLNQSSHEYFHLLTSIIDRMHYDEIKQIKLNRTKLCNQMNSNPILFDHELIEILINFIHEHVPYETQRDKLIEDEVLYGLLCLLTSIIKQYNNSSLKQINVNDNPHYKQLTFHLIDRVFKYLFELPTSENRCVPKCKSLLTRAKSYEFLNELIKINRENFVELQKKLLQQHNSIDRQQPYIWDYWPRDDGRSYLGYVGLTNLGATCYAATSIQHLYMIPELRTAILNASKTGKHDLILYELKRMFAYLLESERRSYNPKSFCKVYTMDGLQSLNTGDQKDMTEFFTDLITKLEEMSDDLKQLVRELFCGILTNIVISFDCPHISRKLEEFYTVRCQVADMKDVHESLAELTVKDTLEGDNMYTCSKCSKKVRAEKRVCFRKLPKILCLNTMRYTFNMVTMQREKVNTLFQFPMQLDMSGYMETNLIDKNKQMGDDNHEHDDDKDNENSNRNTPSSPLTSNESHLFELIGVTVHTGTAEGGHYYSFIRERVKRPLDNNLLINSDSLLDNSSQSQQHRWYLFNDAEVKQFDPSQIANECFGGEITSKGYDQGSDRFLDFQFEKTHSAYMLFYERIDTPLLSTVTTASNMPTLQLKDPIPYIIPKDISDWIWEDNRRFVRDRHLYDHHYFTFMWTLCHHQVSSSPLAVKENEQNEQAENANATSESYDMLPIQLAITFVFETYIHAKDKPTMAGWVEYLCKQFTACKPVAVWFLAHMTQDDTWLTKVLVRCPNHTIRHMFARVLIDVLHKSRFRDSSNEDSLVVQQFIHKYLSIISEGGARLPIRYMSEYFVFLHDFARNGIDECYLLLDCLCIQQLITFYMLHRGRQPKQSSSNNNNCDDGNTSSDDENQSNTNLLMATSAIDDDIIPLNTIRLPTNNNLNRPGIFEKMFPLIGLLLETERARTNLDNFDFHLFIENDFAFIQQQILDNINLKATAHIIQLICYKNDVCANKIVNLLCQWIMNSSNDMNSLQALFKVLTYLIEQNVNNVNNETNDQQQVASILVLDKNWCDFAALIVARIGKLIDICPTQVFEWFNNVVTKSSIIHRWIYNNIRPWLKSYLLYNTYTKVRTLIAQLLVALVPSTIFRQTYRTGKYFLNLSKQQLASAAQATTTTATHGTITSLLTFNQQISTVPNTSSFSSLFDHQQFAQYPSDFTSETYTILRTLLSYLLELLVEIGHDQSELHMNDNQQRLVQYLSVLIHFTRYSSEKSLLTENEYLHSLCSLISHPKLMEDHTIHNGNKLLIFIFLQQLLHEKIFLTNILNYEHEFKQQLPMCLIIVDHEDQELILYNRLFLFIYYNILKQFCQHSCVYAKELAPHKNMSWALKNVLPHVQLYPDACEQLLGICKIICHINRENLSHEDQQVINDFKKELYLLIYRFNDIRSTWTIILDLTRDMCDLQASHDERLQILSRRGLPMLTTIFFTIFNLYHEQNQSQILTIQNDLIYLMSLIGNLLDTADTQIKKQQTNPAINMRNIVGAQWKEKMELVSKLLLLLNSYNSSEIRQRAVDLLKKIIVQLPIQDLTQVAFNIKTIHEQAAAQSHPQLGPYFPRRKQPTNSSQQQGTIERLANVSIHTPFRPHFGMYFKTQLLETSKGRDLEFDRAVHAYYSPYHIFMDSLARYAYNQNALNSSILTLVTLVACEGVQSMHITLFAELCLEISNQSKTSAQTLIHDLIQMSSSYYFPHLIEILLIDERIALHQADNYSFLYTYLPMILAMKKSLTTTNDPIQNFIQHLEQLLHKTCEHCLQSIYNESQTNLDWLQSYKKLSKSINYSHTQIIGDVKALELYLHCQLITDKSKIQSVIEQSVRLIEQHLQLPLQIDDEQQESEATTIVDDENNPIKKRRLDDSNLTIDITNNDPKRKTIMDALQVLQIFLTNMNTTPNDEPTTIEQ